MRRLHRWGLLLALIPAPNLSGQIVEEVWAIVNDSVILKTEVDVEFLRLFANQQMAPPTDSAEILSIKRSLLDQLINQQVILQAAALDSTLALSEEELDGRVQAEVDAQVQQFGTLGRFQAALEASDMTLAIFREQQRTSIYRSVTLQRYMAKAGQDTRRIVVTEEQMLAYFEENRPRFQQQPSWVKFEHVIFRPLPTDSLKSAAYDRAIEVRDLARSGEDFEELARQRSEDPGSRATGGELGWIREGSGFVEEFEDAVFSLRAGVISDPVETQFGYHIILVERIRGGERRTRHILIRWEITPEDITRNSEVASEAHQRIQFGEGLAEVALDLGLEPPDTLQTPSNQLARVSEDYARALASAQDGDVLGPLDLSAEGPNTLAVVVLLERGGGGAPSFEDVRAVIENNLREDLMIETVVDGLRARAYVEIRIDGEPATGGG